jgi:flagellar biosynthetic protein FliQ
VNEQLAIEVARNALIVAFELAGPLLAGSLVVGMVVSIFQAVTQINEQTLSFVPKILVVAGTLVFLGPWMGQTLVTYTVNVFNSVATLAR